jgi:hypothetical protein
MGSYGRCVGCTRKSQLNSSHFCNACQIGYESRGEHPHGNIYESSDSTFSFLPTLFLGIFCLPIGYQYGWFKSVLIFTIGYFLFKYLNRISVFYPVVKWLLWIINVPLLLFFIHFLLYLFGVVDV